VARFVLSDAAPHLPRPGGWIPVLRALSHRIDLTQEVRDEVLPGLAKPGEEELVRAIERHLLRVRPEWNWPEPQFPSLGKGEASCIRAAANLLKRGHECLLLMDDREGRRAVSSRSIAVTGIAAVVGAAKQRGFITSARAAFDSLQQNGFRISEALVQGILESVGEELDRKAGASKRTHARK
jgi:predicted nucleic acid-binding protein